MRRLLPLAVSLALAQAAAASGNEGLPAFEPTIVELRVNGQDDGPTLVVRRDADGALLLRADDLPQLRIRTPARGLMIVDGERYFRFTPDTGAQIDFDEATQSARITLPPTAFLPTVARVTAHPHPTIATRQGMEDLLAACHAEPKLKDERENTVWKSGDSKGEHEKLNKECRRTKF